ncbi:hypothetical protein OPV22_005692 [Ensete ventricosum]|uniref:Uncharacterized protein n=1 Tax=Ensete ventricosum TaxID=4639 RepID=A0AAV8Q3I8_ENSVE|nr:hypothetical protein OPV22_005692 [Ensete ventricosum]
MVRRIESLFHLLPSGAGSESTRSELVEPEQKNNQQAFGRSFLYHLPSGGLVGDRQARHNMYEKQLGDPGDVSFKLGRTNNRGDGLLTAVHRDYLRILNHQELLFNDFGDPSVYGNIPERALLSLNQCLSYYVEIGMEAIVGMFTSFFGPKGFIPSYDTAVHQYTDSDADAHKPPQSSWEHLRS